MIEPFYFGTGSRQLFGVCHTPGARLSRDAGVALCYPMGQEYIRAHRAFLHLAKLLAGRGFHVLRFDFSCCGDSSGNCEQGRLEQWVDDVSTAIDELRKGAMKRIGLVGLRLGATLAMMAAAKQTGIEAMVLWEPVVNGCRYVRELRGSHKVWLCGSFARARRNPAPGQAEEVLGFPLTPSLRGELESIDVLRLDSKPADKVLIVETGPSYKSRGLCEHLAALGATLHCEYTPGPGLWTKKQNHDSTGPVPPAVVQRIAGWICEVL